MRWLIDGNNLLGSKPDGWWRDRRAAVQRLVRTLVAHHGRTEGALTVVFDGPPDAEVAEVGRAGGITVEFAPGRRNAADDVIARMVTEDLDAATLTVVTSDRGLSERVQVAGAPVMGSGSFRRLIEAGR